MPRALEFIAAALFFSNYVLAAAAVALCIRLFRLHRQAGWLVLGVAFLAPFETSLLRLAHGMRLLTYRSVGTDQYGVAQLTFNLQFPGFYLVAVTALIMLIRSARRTKGH